MTTFTTRKIKNILIIIAMEGEAVPIIEALKLTPHHDLLPAPSPCHCFSGNYQGAQISIITNGKDKTYGVDNIGTVPASIATYLGLQHIKPDILINAGTCGGFKRKGAEIGDAFLSTVFKNHDRRIAIPGFDKYGIHHHPAISTCKMAQDLHLKQGVVTTGNSLDQHSRDIEIMLDNDASCKDMEAAGIAWTADLFECPLFACKVVTDIVDCEIHAAHDEFLANFATAQDKLQRTVPLIIDYVIGKTPEEL